MITETKAPQPDFFEADNVFDYIYQLMSVAEPEEFPYRDLPYHQKIIVNELLGATTGSAGLSETTLKEVLWKGTFSDRKVFSRFAKLLGLRVAGGTIGLNRYFVITQMDGWWFIAHNDDYAPQQLSVTSFKSIMDHASTKLTKIPGTDKTGFMDYVTKTLCK